MHKFNPENVNRLESQERLAMQHPSLIWKLAPHTMSTLADIGTGSGLYAKYFAEKNKNLQIYALDIEPDMLSYIKAHTKPDVLSRFTLIKMPETSIPLEDNTIDAVLMINVLHEFQSVPDMLKEVKRILNPGGTVIISDWHKKDTKMGPPVEHRISLQEAISCLSQCRFLHITEHTIYEKHYVITASL
jgi:ubiquinone/menaquinone biosynthesis C-methylase UbiE